ncbi:MAG: radical SAM protein [Nitrososphaerota archaeon]|nr:radical SAM protein [Nitrososphaerota archaeon]
MLKRIVSKLKVVYVKVLETGGGIMIPNLRPPEYVTWLLTSKCNLRCEHCYTSPRPWSNELEEKRVLKIVEEACEMGVENLHFTGGEPLLRRDIFKIIDIVKDSTKTSLFSNLLAMKREKARKLSSMGVQVFTSIDGATRRTHEAIRGNGTWELLMKGISILKDEGVSFTPIFSISGLNFKEAGEFVRLAENLGASSAVLLPVMPFGRAESKDFNADSHVCIEAVSLAEEAAEELGFEITLWCIPFAGLLVESKYVSWDSCKSERIMDIGPNGEVLICDTLDITVSSIKNKSLREAWFELNTNGLFAEIMNNNPCPECPISNTCKGGCYARSFKKYGSFYNSDPLCPRALEEMHVSLTIRKQ